MKILITPQNIRLISVVFCLVTMGCVLTRNIEIYNNLDEPITLEFGEFYAESRPKQNLQYDQVPQEWRMIRRLRCEIEPLKSYISTYDYKYIEFVKIYVNERLLDSVMFDFNKDTVIYIEKDINGKVYSNTK